MITMDKRMVIAGAVVLVVIVLVLMMSAQQGAGPLESIDSFEECVAAGYPVMESYPKQCATPDGRNFVEKVDQPGGGIGIANPASVYCEEQGGDLEIRDTPSGQIGYCHINGKVCEEWAYFNSKGGDCVEPAVGGVGMANPASVYCVEQGGQSEIMDTPEGQTGYCHINGKVCEEWAYFRSEGSDCVSPGK